MIESINAQFTHRRDAFGIIKSSVLQKEFAADERNLQIELIMVLKRIKIKAH